LRVSDSPAIGPPIPAHEFAVVSLQLNQGISESCSMSFLVASLARTKRRIDAVVLHFPE
jgi:hypothetical protein